ncbi:hypothetical protein CPC16_011981 [Podila verticillata]|nr:hypothetical protein CPC16_011981 [Podila verticillata]
MKLSFILSIAAVISVALAQEQPERDTIAKPIDSSENMAGGAVGSFEGSDDYQYGFYNDDSCRRKFLFGASSASIKRIDPIIYPRSVKIWKNDGPPRPDPNQYTAVFWTRSHFGGERKKFTGMGCYDLDGSTIRSIQGTMRYKFYDEPRCYGGRVAEYVGPKNNIRISPKSVYIN